MPAPGRDRSTRRCGCWWRRCRIPDPPVWLYEFFFGPGPIGWVQETFGSGWAPFFRIVTLPGISWGVIVAVALALLLWGRRAAYSVLAVLVLEAIASTILNQIVFLERPAAESIVRYEQLEISSFPSGHVFTATAIWGWLYATGRLHLSVAAVIIGLVGVARLYLGVHFVGDVVGGFVLGCMLVGIQKRVWPKLLAWLERRRSLFFVGLGSASVAAALATPTVLEPGNPYAWNGVGLMVAGPIALALEYWASGEGHHRWPLTATIASAGFLPCLIFWMRLPEVGTPAAAVATGVATLWTWGIAPALGCRLAGPRA